MQRQQKWMENTTDQTLCCWMVLERVTLWGKNPQNRLVNGLGHLSFPASWALCRVEWCVCVVCACICVYVYMYVVCMCVCLCMCVLCVCVNLYMCICVSCVRVYVYMYVCICVYVYTYMWALSKQSIIKNKQIRKFEASPRERKGQKRTNYVKKSLARTQKKRGRGQGWNHHI